MQYLSPSSISQWRKDKREFFLKYMAKAPRLPQTCPMSVGSAFDAYVKSDLANQLGMDCDFEALFESQVEEEHRDFALVAGKRCWDAYRALGGMSDLFVEISDARPVMEDKIQKTINGVVLLGKPDLYWDGWVLDWKVNGFCAKSGASPKKGYKNLRGEWYGRGQAPGPHKDYNYLRQCCFSETNELWALQTCIYGWLVSGFRVPINVGIDQLACEIEGKGRGIRLAQFRGTISIKYQERLFEEISEIWEIVNSQERMAEFIPIEEQEMLMRSAENPDLWFESATRET